eukprot:162364-Rhodomonas_salina.2
MEKNKLAKTMTSKNWVQVLLETDLTDAEDDLLKAFEEEELHLDYANSITLGYHKEQYYLLFMVGYSNFIWAMQTTTGTSLEGWNQKTFCLISWTSQGSKLVRSALTTSSTACQCSRHFQYHQDTVISGVTTLPGRL